MIPYDRSSLDAAGQMQMGYHDGFHDDRDELPEHTNYTKAYEHGWRNGRDDRLHRPRAPAYMLRAVADKLIREDEEGIGS
jgi:ribosome modulation factor